jgi:hypothetical protein
MRYQEDLTGRELRISFHQRIQESLRSIPEIYHAFPTWRSGVDIVLVMILGLITKKPRVRVPILTLKCSLIRLAQIEDRLGLDTEAFHDRPCSLKCTTEIACKAGCHGQIADKIGSESGLLLALSTQGHIGVPLKASFSIPDRHTMPNNVNSTMEHEIKSPG